MIEVNPSYGSIEPVREVCEVFMDLWSGDEWGESMAALHSAGHTDYGMSDEDCAVVTGMLLKYIIEQKGWMETEGRVACLWDQDEFEEAQKHCAEIRDRWLKEDFEPTRKEAEEILAKLPDWMFG